MDEGNDAAKVRVPVAETPAEESAPAEAAGAKVSLK